MTIKMRLSSILAASVLAASAGLATGLAAAPAGATPADVPFTDFCLENPCPPELPDDFEVCTEDCSSHPDDGGEETTPTEDPGGGSVDVPIPANANFTG